MITYPVVEKFISINGEGQKAGELAAFIRMRGCNLSCNYCDTSWANTMDCPCEFLSTEELITWLTEHKIKNVTLTGGEPLLTKGIDTFIEALGSSGFSVEIETNGSVPLQPFAEIPNGPSFTMDYKLPGSGMEKYMLPENFAVLRAQDTVKFVVKDYEDLCRARDVIREYDLTEKCHVYLSPVYGQIELENIVNFMKDNRLNDVNMQLQMHKIIWDSEMRGV